MEWWSEEVMVHSVFQYSSNPALQHSIDPTPFYIVAFNNFTILFLERIDG
jgi:hypothetical protein